MARQRQTPPKSPRGFLVLAVFLSSMALLAFSIAGLFHPGMKWPLKYPEQGPLAGPAAALLALGALFMFIHGAYFLFVLPPNAGPERPRLFFRILNWLGMLMVLGAGLLPDSPGH
jgi:hypothetical protein